MLFKCSTNDQCTFYVEKLFGIDAPLLVCIDVIEGTKKHGIFVRHWSRHSVGRNWPSLHC